MRSLAEAIDVAFLVVHGPYGEDGTLQGFLELAGIPYVGAGVLASAVAMDKVVFKDLMRGHGLPVVDSTWFRRGAWRDEPERVLRQVAELIGERCVVKPARLGSSVGMSLVHDAAELPQPALDEAFAYDSKVIVEAYVANARELECGVLGNDPPIVFEPGEVRSHHEWYDYESKYVDGLADVLPRAVVEPDLAARLKELALAAYRAVDCAGLARVDFLVPEGAIYLSEMNTLPGFTPRACTPSRPSWLASRFTDLIGRLIDLALEADAEGRAAGRARTDGPGGRQMRLPGGRPRAGTPAGARRHRPAARRAVARRRSARAAGRGAQARRPQAAASASGSAAGCRRARVWAPCSGSSPRLPVRAARQRPLAAGRPDHDERRGLDAAAAVGAVLDPLRGEPRAARDRCRAASPRGSRRSRLSPGRGSRPSCRTVSR